MAKIKELKRKRKGRAFRHDYVDHNGKRHREIIEVDTIKEAEEIASMVEAQVAEIKRGLRAAPNPKTLWKEFKMRILKHYELHKAWKTTLRIRDALRNAERIWKKEYLQDILYEDVENFKVRRLKKVSPSTVSIELRGLKAVFNIAKRWQLIVTNPVVGISLPRSIDYRVRRLTDDEIENLLDHADDLNIRDLVQLYLHTGARRSELLPPNFNWDSINWEEKRLTLIGKGNRTRWVPMNETVELILKKRKNLGYETPFNFRPDTVTHKVKKLMVACEIEKASVHTLRKTFGSRLLESKAADIYTVSQLLGHSSVIVTERHYIDILDENYHNAVRSLDNNNHAEDTSSK